MNRLTKITSTVMLASIFLAPVAFAENQGQNGQKMKRFELTGTMVSIDTSANTLTVKDLKGSKLVGGKDQLVLTINADTKIRKDGKKATLADLKAGNKVQASGKTDGTVFTAQRVNAMSAKFEITGDVVSLDTSAKKLTVTVKTGDKTGRTLKGQQATIIYTDSTKLVLNNGLTAIGDIKAGARVNVKGTVEAGMWIATRIALLGTKTEGENNQGEEAKMTAKVNITENGFAPATVTIKKGSTVTWTNRINTLAWPASNPHPTHTDLPGFDALVGLAKDATYSFTFNTVGTFGYHNHLNPSQTGTVIVIQ